MCPKAREKKIFNHNVLVATGTLTPTGTSPLMLLELFKRLTHLSNNLRFMVHRQTVPQVINQMLNNILAWAYVRFTCYYTIHVHTYI